MSIWLYRDSVNSERAVQASFALKRCLFCQTKLESLRADKYNHEVRNDLKLEVVVCPLCGWWKIIKVQIERNFDLNHISIWTTGAIGRLRELDLCNNQEPLEAIRSYLAMRYEDRFKIDPIIFENVVASVYGDLGFSTIATGRSADGGLDIFLRSHDERVIGVQVKRYRGAIKAEFIRAFTGALFLKGVSNGVFVTTSRFQPGATNAASLATARGIAVKLVDGNKFFNELGIAQRAVFCKIEESDGPWHSAPLHEINFTATTTEEPTDDDIPYMFP